MEFLKLLYHLRLRFMRQGDTEGCPAITAFNLNAAAMQFDNPVDDQFSAGKF